MRLLLALALAVVIAPLGALADAFDRFEGGRDAYAEGRYQSAARVFESLIEDEALGLENQPLVLESRKYLGASLLFLDRPEEATQQFELLLRAEPEYRLDPIAFPSAVLTAFDEVRERLVKERATEHERAEEEEAQRRREELRLLLERESRLKQLEELARVERIERPNSRWLALFPFGVGQFKNGHRKAGIFFATTQGAMAGMAFATFVAHAALPSLDDPTQDRAKIRQAQRVRAGLNWGSAGLFTLLYMVSVIDAQLRYVPVRVEERERSLPDLSRRLRFEPDPEGFSLRF
jgi:tetratricopeptide (TPR) repeat protein